jgi:type I restriction enzyme S subunit
MTAQDSKPATARYKRYPAYKDSGVEWVGEIPEGWSAKRLKFIAAEPIKNGIGEAGAHDNPEWPRYVRITDIAGARELREDTFRSLPPKLAREAPFKVGDLLLAAVGATFGKSYLHVRDCGPACFAGYLVRLSPGRDVEPSFAAYWTESAAYWALMQSRVVQATIQNFSAAKYRELVLPVPSIPEQRAIATFLDRATARIDGLVAKKERLIELLQERRTALITSAVTKGLHLTVPMKDSGIEWLGQIPEHWGVERIKWAASMVSGHTPDKKVESYWQGGDIPWVSLADTAQLRAVDFIAATAVMTTRDGIAHSSAHVLPAGTVVFSRDASIGLCAITRAGMAVSQHFIGWVCGKRLRPEYLLFVLRSMTQELERLTMGATVRTIGMPDVKSLVTPIPARTEQDEIVRYVLHHRARFDALISKVFDAIDHLKELRAALISAAVTGKIDVREETA